MERKHKFALEKSREKPPPLTVGERSVVQLRLGTLDGNPRTLKQTGIELGVSVSTVKRIQRSAFDKLDREASRWIHHWR